jgi:hypothetical protein
LWDELGGPNEDDHDWHTIEGVREACSNDVTLSVWGTKEELFQRFQNCNYYKREVVIQNY